jgi:hypothetical protein
MKRFIFPFGKSKDYRRVRFQTSDGRWVFLTIWRDVFGDIRTIKNVSIRAGELSYEERKCKTVRKVAVLA